MEQTSERVQLVVHEQGWAEVILNRPHRKNAITGPLGLDLASALRHAEQNPLVRVILLKGAGGSFCSGLDLKEFNAEPQPEWLADFQHIWRDAHRALFESTKPIVGCLQKYAINGGAALALACDLLIVGDESFLQVGEVQIGMAAPYNLAWLSLRHSEGRVAQTALVGDRMYGPQLQDMGIAYRSVDEAQTQAVTAELCERLAGYREGGLQRIKAGLRSHLTLTADQWFDQFTVVDPGSNRPKPSSMPR